MSHEAGNDNFDITYTIRENGTVNGSPHALELARFPQFVGQIRSLRSLQLKILGKVCRLASDGSPISKNGIQNNKHFFKAVCGADSLTSFAAIKDSWQGMPSGPM